MKGLGWFNYTSYQSCFGLLHPIFNQCDSPIWLVIYECFKGGRYDNIRKIKNQIIMLITNFTFNFYFSEKYFTFIWFVLDFILLWNFLLFFWGWVFRRITICYGSHRAEEKYQLGTGLMLRSDVGKQNGEQILRRTLQQQQLVKQSFYLHGIIYKIRSYWIPPTNIQPHLLHPTLQNSALRCEIPNYGAQEKLAGMQTHLYFCVT